MKRFNWEIADSYERAMVVECEEDNLRINSVTIHSLEEWEELKSMIDELIVTEGMLEK